MACDKDGNPIHVGVDDCCACAADRSKAKLLGDLAHAAAIVLTEGQASDAYKPAGTFLAEAFGEMTSFLRIERGEAPHE